MEKIQFYGKDDIIIPSELPAIMRDYAKVRPMWIINPWNINEVKQHVHVSTIRFSNYLVFTISILQAVIKENPDDIYAFSLEYFQSKNEPDRESQTKK